VGSSATPAAEAGGKNKHPAHLGCVVPVGTAAYADQATAVQSSAAAPATTQ
jgi:hypothetical protein